MVQFKNGKKFISNTPIYIKDYPKLPHRGLLLDTSRNYYPLATLKKTIDGLGYSKMNVFHWHLTDSNSFPFMSKKHPILWQKGSLLPGQVYSMEDIKELVEYGLDRGIRIIPELEAPAHSYAMGVAYPEIGVCMDKDAWWDNAMQPPSGQIDPTNPLSKKIVNDLIDEFSTVFKDKYMHLSGDEVNLNCWKSSPKIVDYVSKHNVTYNDLLESFAKDMHKRAMDNKRKVMVYQEMLLNHKVELPKDSLIHAWLDASDAKKIVDLGYKVISSSYKYWYLDCGRGEWIGVGTGNSWCDPYKSWQIIYSYDLFDKIEPNQYKLIHGGEVAMWSEQTDHFNLDPLIWPRTAVAGEVLWYGNKDKSNQMISPKFILDRLNNFRFRLTDRGFNAQALQPLWCVLNPGRCG
ncbi:glycoside hydrolase [Neoconidiobolus thromboides FSU 785]|nr:glycoside hydrolase [Neoconidiobolus thromboides FSU 785]